MRGFLSFVGGGIFAVGALGIGFYVAITPTTWLDVSVQAVEAWDPATGRWTPAGALLEPVSEGRFRALDRGELALVDARAPRLGPARVEAWSPRSGAWSFLDDAPPEPPTPDAPAEDVAVLPLPEGRAVAFPAPPARGAARALLRGADGAWQPAGVVSLAFSVARAAALPGGRVLVVGARTVGGGDRGAALWDPAAARWAPVAAPPFDVRASSLVGLADGRALLVGGDASRPGRWATWSPAGGAWTEGTTTLHAPRLAPALAALPDGRVLAAGGVAPGVARRDEPGMRRRWEFGAGLVVWLVLGVVAGLRLRPWWPAAVLGGVVVGGAGMGVLLRSPVGRAETQRIAAALAEAPTEPPAHAPVESPTESPTESSGRAP